MLRFSLLRHGQKTRMWCCAILLPRLGQAHATAFFRVNIRLNGSMTSIVEWE